MTGLIVAAATLAAAVLVGLVLRARNGRMRMSTAAGETAPAAQPAAELPSEVRGALSGDAVTLVQISTTFCAPCRHTRALLSHVAERTDGLVHVDLDVTDKPEIARDLGVLRTPTTIAYAEGGAELLRVSGLPRKDALLEALEPHLRQAQGTRARPTE